MARALFKLAALSRAIGVLGVSDPNIGKSNVFMCELSTTGDSVPVVFDSSLNAPLSSVSTDVAKFYFQKVTSTNAISVDFTVDFSSVKTSTALCRMSDSSMDLPVSVIDVPGVLIAVVATGPQSTFFATRAAVSTNRLIGGDKIDMIISEKADAVDDKMGCMSNNEDRMVMDMSSETSWEFGLESIGLLTKEPGYTVLSVSSNPVKAIVSTASEGLGFPESLYEQFKTILESAGLQLNNGVVNDCQTNIGGVSKSFPDIVLTFPKQQGYGIRIEAADYVETLAKGQCRLKVSKTSGDVIVLGDSFIKSGYVELNKAQKLMMACPNKQYHLTDKQFDDSIPVADRPAARDAAVTDTPKNDVNTIGEDQEKDTNYQALIIGLTVSGVVLIVGVVVFFVVRKRRAEKMRSSEPRFDASRSMIHDPSEVSSVEGVGAVRV